MLAFRSGLLKRAERGDYVTQSSGEAKSHVTDGEGSCRHSPTLLVPLSPVIPASAGSQGELVHNEGIWGERGARGEQD